MEARGVQEGIIIAVHEGNNLRFVTAHPTGSEDGALVGIGWKPVLLTRIPSYIHNTKCN